MQSAGKLTERISIEQRTAAQDEVGQPIETWSLVAAVWASVRHPSGVAAIKADADVSTVKASFRIRYMTGIDAGMRIAHGATQYDIQAVLPNRAERYIDLVCEVTK